MPDHPEQPNAEEREGVTRRHLFVGSLVVFLPIVVLGFAGAYVGYQLPRMEADRKVTPPPVQTSTMRDAEASAAPKADDGDNRDTADSQSDTPEEGADVMDVEANEIQ